MNFSNEKKRIKDALKSNDDLINVFKKANAMLAGGAMTSIYRNKPIADFDLYFRSKSDIADVIDYLQERRFVCMAKSDRSALFLKENIYINVIYFKYFNNLSEVFELFDFTCCMCGYDFKTDTIESHPSFYRDTLLGNIVYSAKSKYPLAALLRVQKYINKGFNVSKKEMIRMILHCQKTPVESMDDVADQVGSLYGTNVKEAIGKIEPFSIDAVIERLSEIEDTNFEPEEKKVLQIDWDVELFKDLYYILDAGPHHCLCRAGRIQKKATNQEITDFCHKSYRLKFPFYVYKHVKDAGSNKLCSYFNPTFRYVVGQEVSSKDPGIYTYLPENLRNGMYKPRGNAVAIEIRVDCATDIISLSQSELRIKRGVATRIIEKEEYDGENSKIGNGYLDEQQQVLQYARIGRPDTSEVREDWFIGSDKDLSN